MTQVDFKPAGCPFQGVPAELSPSFSVIDALGGFVRLERRQATLDGGILVRASACKSYLDGNEAGLHISLADSVMISRDESRPALQMTDDHFQLLHGNYEASVQKLVESGLLIENGFWHDRLRQGGVVRLDGVISIWTGLLVKPASGLWLLSAGAFNRRSEVNVRETVIASSEGYTPLILELALFSMEMDTMWIETELACLVPLQPGVDFARSHLSARPDLGQILNDFFVPEYFEGREVGRNVGRYRKLVAGEATSPAPGRARCDLVHIAGPDLNTLEVFGNLVGPAGPLPAELAKELPFAVLRSPIGAEFNFDGIRMHLHTDANGMLRDALEAAWRDAYGAANQQFIQFWAEYFLDAGPKGLANPIMVVTPYELINTPPGWSTLVDGYHYPGLDGLRGTVSTDLFPHAAPVFHFRRTGEFRLEAGAPVARLLPVPRDLLEARHWMVEFASVAV